MPPLSPALRRRHRISSDRRVQPPQRREPMPPPLQRAQNMRATTPNRNPRQHVPVLLAAVSIRNRCRSPRHWPPTMHVSWTARRHLARSPHGPFIRESFRPVCSRRNAASCWRGHCWDRQKMRWNPPFPSGFPGENPHFERTRVQQVRAARHRCRKGSALMKPDFACYGNWLISAISLCFFLSAAVISRRSVAIWALQTRDGPYNVTAGKSCGGRISSIRASATV